MCWAALNIYICVNIENGRGENWVGKYSTKKGENAYNKHVMPPTFYLLFVLFFYLYSLSRTQFGQGANLLLGFVEAYNRIYA